MPDIISSEELDEFVHALKETVVGHPITVDEIKRCLPIMGQLRDFGIKHELVLREALSLQDE